MDTALAPTGSEQERIVVSHVIKGRLETDVVVEHRSRGRGTTVVTPGLNLNGAYTPTSRRTASSSDDHDDLNAVDHINDAAGHQGSRG